MTVISLRVNGEQVQVVRDGNFLAVLSEREEAAAAADGLSQRVTWEPAEELPDQSRLAARSACCGTVPPNSARGRWPRR